MNSHLIKSRLLDLAHYTWYLCSRIIFIVICAYYNLLSNIEQAIEASDYLSIANAPVKDLRIPNHIALSFTNESKCLDYKSIARLLVWCKQLSMSYITLYDDQGFIKENKFKLFRHVESIMRTLGCEKPISVIEGLTILSRLDGRQKFVEDSKVLSRLDPQDINLDVVQKQVGWQSDPELLISFGATLCLYGFPPWQLRLTEILSIPTHKKLPQKIFLDCLRKYSRTSQREGV